MLSFLRHFECPACRHRHTFGLPAGDWPDGTGCNFMCPETGRRATLYVVGPLEKARYHPQGAVQLTPVPQP